MSVAALCPSCAAPVSASAISCAFCDVEIRALPGAVAALAATTTRRPSAETPVAGAVRRLAMRGLTRLLKVALVLVALAGAALVGFVMLLTKDLRRISEDVVRRTEAQLAARRAEAAWPAVEALMVRSARFPGSAPVAAAPDTGAARLLATASVSLNRLHTAPWAIDTAVLARLGANQPTSRGNAPRMAIKLLPGTLPDSVRVALARDTLSPWLATWRRAARSAPFAPLWMYEPGLPGVTDPYSLTLPSFAAIKGLSWRNASSGVLALAKGDTATAVRRLRENIAVGLQLAREPMTMHHMIGRAIVRDGAFMLAEVGRVAGDSALVREGTRLDTTARYDMVPAQQSPLGWGAMAADPASPAALRFLHDGALAPAQRAAVAQGIVLGGCQRTREVLFGFDARRADATEREVARLGADAAGVARMSELWLRGARAWTSDVAAATANLRDRDRARPPLLRALERAGLDGVAARLTICGHLVRALR